jgi:hypothetical protein
MNRNNRRAGINRREFMKVSAAAVVMLLIDHVGRFVLSPIVVDCPSPKLPE